MSLFSAPGDCINNSKFEQVRLSQFFKRSKILKIYQKEFFFILFWIKVCKIRCIELYCSRFWLHCNLCMLIDLDEDWSKGWNHPMDRMSIVQIVDLEQLCCEYIQHYCHTYLQHYYRTFQEYCHWSFDWSSVHRSRKYYIEKLLHRKISRKHLGTCKWLHKWTGSGSIILQK